MAIEYERRALELLIDGWELEATGQLSDQPLTLVAELIYPRPRIARRDQTRALPPEVSKKVDWSSAPFHRRVLFKELVEGPFSIGITIQKNESDSIFGSFFRSDFRAAGEEAAEEAIDLVTPAPLGSALEVLSEAGLDAFEESRFSNVIATGTVELDSANPAERETLPIELISPARIHNPRPNPHPERHTDYEEFLKESGDPNGQITLEYSIFDR